MLANTKAAVFMIAFYPQFVPADRPLFATTALLALLQVAVEIALYLALAAVVGRAGAWFRRPVIRRRLEAVSGTVLIALGLRIAARLAKRFIGLRCRNMNADGWLAVTRTSYNTVAVSFAGAVPTVLGLEAAPSAAVAGLGRWRVLSVHLL